MASLIVINVSGADLSVTGSRGSDLDGVNIGQQVANGEATVVARFNEGSGDRWDWVFLGSSQEQKYQIYVEDNRGTIYQSFGYFNAKSSQPDSNPSPFPAGYAVAVKLDSGDFLYVLLRTPPAR